MLVRLANVIYWVCVVFAWACAIVGATMTRDGSDAIYLLLGLGVASYATGWTLRYILTGTTTP